MASSNRRPSKMPACSSRLVSNRSPLRWITRINRAQASQSRAGRNRDPTTIQARNACATSCTSARNFSPATIAPARATPAIPPLPVWNDAFGPDDLEAVHAEAERARTPLSLYMHLPFCESLCLFCACNVIIQKDKRVAISLSRSPQTRNRARGPQHLPRTPRRAIPLGRRHAHVSHAGANRGSVRIRARSISLFRRTPKSASKSIPASPLAAHLETLRALGFNRLSMGIQDFHPEVQQAINRIQPFELTRDLLTPRAT